MSKQSAAKVKYMSYNKVSHKHEEVTVFTPGSTVIKMFLCPWAGKFVTVPGASLFTVAQNGELIEAA